MLKSSLLEILRTFTKPELIKFEDFVRSPYHNKKENVTKLFLEIKKFSPEFTNDSLEKEKVWQTVFPGKAYNYGIMKNIIHDLGKLCESFLSEEVYKKNTIQRDLDFMLSVSERNINSLLMNKFDSAERVFSKVFENTEDDFISDNYEKLRDYYDLKILFLQSNRQFKQKDELVKFSEYLIFGFLIKCFSTYHKLIINNLQFNKSLEKNIIYLILKEMDENKILKCILDYVKENSSEKYPILKCYYSMYKALYRNDSFEFFHEFKNDLTKYGNLFSEYDLRDLFNCLLASLTNRKFTTLDFYSEYISIVEFGFKSKVILNRDGSLAPEIFISIVNLSSSNNKIEYTENFIAEYKDKLPEELRESLYNYSMAYLNFYKSNYEKSLEFIVKFQTKNLMEKFFIKNIQLSIYYELNDRVSFDYSIDNFRHFIKKNNLSNESRVITLTKYSDYVNRFFKLREKPNAFDLSKLKKEITVNKASNKIWLLKKIDELEKIKS